MTPTTYKKYEKEVVNLIANHIAVVWKNAHHYAPEYPEANYPLHDDLLYKHQRTAVLSALEGQNTLQSEAYHSEYNYLKYEQSLNKSISLSKTA